MTPLDAYYQILVYRNKKDKSLKINLNRLEKIIATDSTQSYYYARDVINNRFELGEEAISKDAVCSYHYVLDVIKQPFEKCHPIIFYSRFKDDYIRFLKVKKYDLSNICEWLI